MAVHEAVAAAPAIPARRRRAVPYTLAAGVAIVVALALLALAGAVHPPYDPLATNPALQLAPPGPGHPLGTDSYGRDMLSRIMAGAGLDLLIAVLVTAISFSLGVVVGSASAYLGGWVDDVVLRIVDIVQSFPAFVLALAITAVLGNSLRNVVIAIAVAYTPYFIRLTRGEVLAARRADYAENARAVGNPAWRIVLLHLLPNSVAPAVVQASLTMGWSILDASGLSFLGLGLKPPTPEWGVEVSEGASNIVAGQWWTSVFPGAVIALAVIGFNLIGDALRDRFGGGR